MKYAVVTFGCKVNQYESNVISSQLEQAGYEKTDDAFEADAVVINSCTVTESSDKKACRLIRQLRENSADTLIVLTGCFPQSSPSKASALPADIIIGTENKATLAKKIDKMLKIDKKERSVVIPDRPTNARYEELGFSKSDMTRAYIKIEDGCDSFCSYCMIPYARGNVRSRSLEEIEKEARLQVAHGHKELILVGINLSCYGKDTGKRLTDAVIAACESGAYRVRLSSLEPELLTKEDIEIMSRQKPLCPHFHLSLQSGSAATLRRMNRHYDPDGYYEAVKLLREYFPDCSITTDVMVGFVGETDEEFEESLAFCEKVGFTAMHVFTYSVREGTAAAKMDGRVDKKTARERYDRMTALASKMREQRLCECVGKQYEVLIQLRESPEYANGLTAQYLPVRIFGSTASRHDVVRVKITKSVGSEYLVGEEIM